MSNNTVIAAPALDVALADYAAATTGDKTRLRNAASANAMAAILAGDVESAAAWAAISTAYSAHRTPTTSGPDYAAIASDLAATLESAAMRLRAGVEVDGVGIVRATEAGTVDEKRATELATVRTRAARSGNGSVAAFIAAHVGDEPRSAAELLNAASVDGYRPSSGAIGACFVRVLNGTEEPEGFTVDTIQRDGKLVRVAIAE